MKNITKKIVVLAAVLFLSQAKSVYTKALFHPATSNNKINISGIKTQLLNQKTYAANQQQQIFFLQQKLNKAKNQLSKKDLATVSGMQTYILHEKENKRSAKKEFLILCLKALTTKHAVYAAAIILLISTATGLLRIETLINIAWFILKISVRICCWFLKVLTKIVWKFSKKSCISIQELFGEIKESYLKDKAAGLVNNLHEWVISEPINALYL